MKNKEDEIILMDKINLEGKVYHYSLKTEVIEEILQIRDGQRRGKKINVYNNSLAWQKPVARRFA